MNDLVGFLDQYKSKQNNESNIVDILKVTDMYYYTTLLRDKEHVSNFEKWKKQHELFEPFLINQNIKDHEKTLVTIDSNIDNIEDIINIIEKYQVNPNEKYNIDLESLHLIKSELNEINNMIGMSEIKNSIVHQLIYFIQKMHINDETSNVCDDYKHTVIYGPPGTGKTEIAKIIGKMYSKIGILKKNIFRKVTRNDLVAGYLGQTALKTTDVINSCLGGCLFIDEAYSLANYNDLDSYSKECLDTICEALSNHKNDLMVIIAGYEDELNNTFFAANKGLESRFIWRFNIDTYNAKELLDIFKKKVKDAKWNYDDSINTKWFETRMDSFKHFGRDIEMFFSNVKIAHSSRIFGKNVELRKIITLEDIENGYVKFMKHKNVEKKINLELYV
jgi:SpoVK/Ycf46/Vps4 family AAA+-type ATPase